MDLTWIEETKIDQKAGRGSHLTDRMERGAEELPSGSLWGVDPGKALGLRGSQQVMLNSCH